MNEELHGKNAPINPEVTPMEEDPVKELKRQLRFLIESGFKRTHPGKFAARVAEVKLKLKALREDKKITQAEMVKVQRDAVNDVREEKSKEAELLQKEVDEALADEEDLDEEDVEGDPDSAPEPPADSTTEPPEEDEEKPEEEKKVEKKKKAPAKKKKKGKNK